eukprot:696221_1
MEEIHIRCTISKGITIVAASSSSDEDNDGVTYGLERIVDAHEQEQMDEDVTMMNKHDGMIQMWNENTRKLDAMVHKWMDNEPCVQGKLLYDKYMECAAVVDEQTERLNQITLSGHIPQLIECHNRLKVKLFVCCAVFDIECV